MMDGIVEAQGKDLAYYLDVLRRYKTRILVISAVLMLISILLAILWPATYRSTATVLIEEQEVPPELVRSTVTSYADQRIQVISQQVMTRQNLLQLMDKYDLYHSKRARKTNDELLDIMRDDIKLNIISANVIDRRSGAKTTATIAFNLSFDGETASNTQKVTNELVSLYLGQNLKTRQENAAQTSVFLTQEAQKLTDHLAELESKLAEFKSRNFGRLPELTQLNYQIRDRTEAELAENAHNISTLEDRRFYLEGQLAQMKPNSPIISETGERILDNDQRLRVKEAQYASMAGVYTDSHPDMIRLKGEIDALKKAGASTGDDNESAKQLEKKQAELVVLSKKYSENHPDVVKAKREIDMLARQASATADATSIPTRKPENPAYITFQAQLESTANELATMRAKRNELKEKIAKYESRLEGTPLVEKDYTDLLRDRELTQKNFQEIQAKLMDAKVGQQLENDSKGERFSLIDPPQLPEKPISPNRPAIVLLGVLLSLGGGLSYAGVKDSLDHAVRNPAQLNMILNAPMLAAIPYMQNVSERAKSTRNKGIRWITGVLAVVAVALAVHFLYIPLDVFWYKLLRFAGM